eukprot:GHVP01016914.1.p1 GENE.GHVP01016914.1~~GHVP01016914.1.p1  ORF type:complete len:222 (+),score=17.15 GHVP01016914.1:903-1568(+)
MPATIPVHSPHPRTRWSSTHVESAAASDVPARRAAAPRSPKVFNIPDSAKVALPDDPPLQAPVPPPAPDFTPQRAEHIKNVIHADPQSLSAAPVSIAYCDPLMRAPVLYRANPDEMWDLTMNMIASDEAFKIFDVDRDEYLSSDDPVGNLCADLRHNRVMMRNLDDTAKTLRDMAAHHPNSQIVPIALQQILDLAKCPEGVTGHLHFSFITNVPQYAAAEC